MNELLISEEEESEVDSLVTFTRTPSLLRKQLSSNFICDIPDQSPSPSLSNSQSNQERDIQHKEEENDRVASSSVKKSYGIKATTKMPSRKLARATSALFAKSVIDPTFSSRLRPTLILGLLYFKNEIDINILRQVIQDRLLAEFGRFRSKIVLDGTKILFHELPANEISLDYHVQEIDATGWHQKQIDQFLTSKYKENKSLDSPLWIFYLLKNLADGRHCIVANIDHCIGDGITMVQVLLSLLDDQDEVKNPTPPQNSPEVHSKTKSKKKNSASSLTLLESLGTFVGGIFRGLLGSVLPGDSQNSLKMKDYLHPGTDRVCAFGEKIPLAQVKEIRSKFQNVVTVNDILAAVLNMAIRRYFEEKNEPILKSPERAVVRANFPINMRKKGANLRDTFGNVFSSGAFAFDFTYSSRIDLLWSVKKQVDRIKLSPQPIVELNLLTTLSPLLPSDKLIDIVLETFGKYTMMLSNVPGPSSTAYFCSQPIDDISFVALGPLGVYCGLVSYNGQVSCGICSDKSVETNPEKITQYWREEFDALYRECMAVEGDILPKKKLPHSIILVVLGMILGLFVNWWKS